MFVVDVKPDAPWASSPAYVRAGSRVAAIRIYTENLTGIAYEGDLGDDEISCVSFPSCPSKSTMRVENFTNGFPGEELLPPRGPR